jgi:hypothetical protein
LDAHALKCSSGTDSDSGFCWKWPMPARRAAEAPRGASTPAAQP